MVSWPELGTRVTLRYRRAPGSVPPLSDAVGHLLAVDPTVRVRTKTGVVVDVAPAEVVALRVLTDRPVRTSDIRNLEYAGAAADSGGERHWHRGWLLRAGGGAALHMNSAVPLDISARFDDVAAIVDWYTQRGLTPILALPDRLLRAPSERTAEYTEQVLVRDLPEQDSHAHPAEAKVTDAPDGTRWVGLPAPAAQDGALREALLSRGAAQGATRAYLRVPDTGADAPAPVPGFRLHHRCRYVPAR